MAEPARERSRREVVLELLRLRSRREGATHVVSAQGAWDARSSDRPGRFLVRRGPARCASRLLDHERRAAALLPDMTSVAIVGGGFGGIGAAVMLQREGYEDVTVFERGERVGGVWNFNTYPGIACDVPSHLYEFSFAPNPNWSRRYAPGRSPGLHGGRGTTPRGARPRRLRTEVKSASFDEATRRWKLETRAGPHEADVLVTACGQLSLPSIPPIPGLEDFAGPSFHTARWRDDVELTGKWVALVGTGCSSIQVGPSIQPDVAQLDVYQRSPGWTLP